MLAHYSIVDLLTVAVLSIFRSVLIMQNGSCTTPCTPVDSLLADENHPQHYYFKHNNRPTTKNLPMRGAKLADCRNRHQSTQAAVKVASPGNRHDGPLDGYQRHGESASYWPEVRQICRL